MIGGLADGGYPWRQVPNVWDMWMSVSREPRSPHEAQVVMRCVCTMQRSTAPAMGVRHFLLW